MCPRPPCSVCDGGDHHDHHPGGDLDPGPGDDGRWHILGEVQQGVFLYIQREGDKDEKWNIPPAANFQLWAGKSPLKWEE